MVDTVRTINGYDVGDVAVLNRNDAWAVGGNAGGHARRPPCTGTAQAWRKVAMPLTAFKIAAVSKNDVWAVGEGAERPAVRRALERQGLDDRRSCRRCRCRRARPASPTSTTSPPLAKDNVWAVGRLLLADARQARPQPDRPHALERHEVEPDARLDRRLRAERGLRRRRRHLVLERERQVRAPHDGTGATTTVAAPVPRPARPGADIRDIASIPGPEGARGRAGSSPRQATSRGTPSSSSTAESDMRNEARPQRRSRPTTAAGRPNIRKERDAKDVVRGRHRGLAGADRAGRRTPPTRPGRSPRSTPCPARTRSRSSRSRRPRARGRAATRRSTARRCRSSST